MKWTTIHLILASAVLLAGIVAFAATEDTSWGKVKEQVKGDTQPAAKKAAKVDICHYDADADLFKVINISGNAVDKHIENHGDSLPSEFFADTDGDGYGDPNGATDVCPNTGFVDNDDDCDDTNAAVNPGATEIVGNGIDDDCNPDTPDVAEDTCPCGTAENAEPFFSDPLEPGYVLRNIVTRWDVGVPGRNITRFIASRDRGSGFGNWCGLFVGEPASSDPGDGAFFVKGISEVEYQTCVQEVQDLGALLGLD
jgi:hypothetical protein